MPLIVRILAEDLAAWELTHQTAAAYHYRPAGVPVTLAERVQVVSPAPLQDLVGKDLVCFINIEKGWLSRDLGKRPEVKLQLKRPREPIRDPRRLRLRASIEWDHGGAEEIMEERWGQSVRIRAVHGSSKPPRVTLEEFKEEL
jgi:hypothetical protein